MMMSVGTYEHLHGRVLGVLGRTREASLDVRKPSEESSKDDVQCFA